MFDIRFLDAPPEPRDDGGLDLWGRSLSATAERGFSRRSPCGRVSATSSSGVRRPNGYSTAAERTAFFTVALQVWLTMARDGEAVPVQEELLTDETVEGSALCRTRRRALRATAADYAPTEDGERFSPWHITLTHVETFAARHRESGVA